MQSDSDTIIDLKGNALSGIAVRVFAADGSLAQLYSDNGLTPVLNPVYTDPNGRYVFYAANGRYTTQIEPPGSASYEGKEILLFDPADDPAGFLSPADYPSQAEAVMASAGKRLLVGPGEQITVNVPDDIATISDAFAAIAGWVVAGTGAVTIKVADGTYAHSAGVVLNHPFGSRIRLVGNETTPANCVIQASGAGFDGLTVSNGNVLGYINGFTIRKATKAPFADNSTALLAVSGGRIICGSKIVVDNWYYGIAARDGSYIYAPFAQVDHAGDVGIWAFVGSTIDCPNAVSNNASDTANGWGYGFQAEYGSSLNCSNGSASGCNIGGIASLSNSNVRALGATASSNAGSGFLARDGGTIETHNAIANNNTRYGIEEIGAGQVIGNSMTTTGNTLGGTKPKAYFDNSNLGARIVGEGDFRIDLASTGAWYFNAPGGLQLSGSDTAGAVNRWNFTGSASGQPLRWAPVGSDTNIAAQLEAKGNEVVRLMSNGRPAFQGYNGSASAVNYGQCSGSITGQAVAFSAQGADANITFAVFGKGTGGTLIESNAGRLAFYGGTPAAKPAITGSRGGNAALASVLTQLATLGLLTDSTTA